MNKDDELVRVIQNGVDITDDILRCESTIHFSFKHYLVAFHVYCNYDDKVDVFDLNSIHFKAEIVTFTTLKRDDVNVNLLPRKIYISKLDNANNEPYEALGLKDFCQFLESERDKETQENEMINVFFKSLVAFYSDFLDSDKHDCFEKLEKSIELGCH